MSARAAAKRQRQPEQARHHVGGRHRQTPLGGRRPARIRRRVRPPGSRGRTSGRPRHRGRRRARTGSARAARPARARRSARRPGPRSAGLRSARPPAEPGQRRGDDVADPLVAVGGQHPGGGHGVDEGGRQRVGQPAQLQPRPARSAAGRRCRTPSPARPAGAGRARGDPPAGQPQPHHRAVLGPMGPEDAGTRIGCSHPDILESRSGRSRPPRWRWYGDRKALSEKVLVRHRTESFTVRTPATPAGRERGARR